LQVYETCNLELATQKKFPKDLPLNGASQAKLLYDKCRLTKNPAKRQGFHFKSMCSV